MFLKILALALIGIGCLAMVLRVIVDVRDSLRDLRVISGHTYLENPRPMVDLAASALVVAVGLGFAVL